ncbi:hypothetical protein AVEN_224464-1, partial [Araneus ventricosus]
MLINNLRIRKLTNEEDIPVAMENPKSRKPLITATVRRPNLEKENR